MKNFLIFLSVSIIIFVLFIKGFFGISFFQQIRGFHQKSNYWIQEPIINFSFLPKQYMTDIYVKNTDIGHIVEAYTTTKAIQGSGQDLIDFSIGENVTLLLGEGAWLKGTITEINKDYVDEDHPKNNFKWQKYTLLIDTTLSPKENIKDFNSSGALVKSTDDYRLILPIRAIREINNKQYVCVVSKDIEIAGIGDAPHRAIKFKLKEIIAGPKIYTFTSDAEWIEVSGLELMNQIVYADDRIDGPKGLRFNCPKL